MRHINYLVLLLVACCVGACSSPKNDTKDAYPMFWTWLDYQPGMNFDSICTIMNEAGIDGVMLNALLRMIIGPLFPSPKNMG